MWRAPSLFFGETARIVVALSMLLQFATVQATTSPAPATRAIVPAPIVSSAASSSASAPPPVLATATLPGRTYAPTFLPKDVQFSAQELEEIRAAAAKQMVSYYLSLAQTNETVNSFQLSERERWASKAQYDAWTARHTPKVFERQAIYTQVIFWMVIGIVASGIALTWYQFVHDTSLFSSVVGGWLRSRGHNRKDKEADDAMVTTLLEVLRAQQSMEIGKDGLKITTRVLGLITLAMSMGFFYLYLAYVYPITVKETTSIPADSEVRKTAK